MPSTEESESIQVPDSPNIGIYSSLLNDNDRYENVNKITTTYNFENKGGLLKFIIQPSWISFLPLYFFFPPIYIKKKYLGLISTIPHSPSQLICLTYQIHPTNIQLTEEKERAKGKIPSPKTQGTLIFSLWNIKNLSCLRQNSKFYLKSPMHLFHSIQTQTIISIFIVIKVGKKYYSKIDPSWLCFNCKSCTPLIGSKHFLDKGYNNIYVLYVIFMISFDNNI